MRRILSSFGHLTSGMSMNEWHDAERRVEKARELFEQRKWEEALEELRAATSINPYNSGWYFNIGLTLDEMQRYDEAVTAYRQALEIDADDVQSLNHLGMDLYRLGQLRQSIRVLERIEGIDPSFEPCYCHRISAYSELGDHEKAEEMFYLARLYKDECPHCYYNMGCSLAARHQYDKAIACWQKTLDLDSEHPDVHIRISEAMWARGDLEQARRHYLASLRQDPGNTQTLLDLGGLLVDMGRIDEAGEKFRRAIELSPEMPATHFCHGQWLLRCGQADQAIAAFSRTLEQDPTFPGAHLRLAAVHFKENRLAEARKHLRGEILLHPQDVQTLLELGDLLLDVGDSRAAGACFKRLVQIDPEHVAGWQNLAVSLFARGRFEEGVASCMQAMECNPRNLLTHYNLALAHEHLHDFDHGLEWARQGLAIDPSDSSLQKLEFRLRVLRWRQRLADAFRGFLRFRSRQA